MGDQMDPGELKIWVVMIWSYLQSSNPLDLFHMGMGGPSRIYNTPHLQEELASAGDVEENIKHSGTYTGDTAGTLDASNTSIITLQWMMYDQIALKDGIPSQKFSTPAQFSHQELAEYELR